MLTVVALLEDFSSARLEWEWDSAACHNDIMTWHLWLMCVEKVCVDMINDNLHLEVRSVDKQHLDLMDRIQA